MAAISGKQAKIRYTSVAGTSSTDNAATITTGLGSANSSIQINATGRRHWDRSDTATPTLWLNSTLVPTTAIASYNHVQGIINLNESRTSTGTYTIDMHYLTTTHLALAQSWDVSFDNSMYETTSMSTTTGDVQWRTFEPGLTNGTVTISKFVSTGDTGPLFYDRMNLESDYILELITNGNNRYEAYGYTASQGISAGIDQVTVESVDFQLDGPIYYSTT